MKHRLLLLWSWLVMLTTGWLPDLPGTMRLRGWLLGRCMRSCGTDFQVASGVIVRGLECLRLGNHVFMGNGTWIAASIGITIGDEVLIGPYVVIADGNHTRRGCSYRFGPRSGKPIRVGDGAWVGAHAALLAGVTVGAGAMVGAGAVVTRDVPAGSMCGGVPARPIGDTNGQRSDARGCGDA